MHAIRVHAFGGPETLQLTTCAQPEPGAGEVLIRLHAAGVNPVETYIRAGAYPVLPSLPWTPGHDGAGEVAGLGAGVTDLSLGDRVYVAGSLTGTYAEACVSARQTVHRLPEQLGFEQGAGIGVPCTTAWHALFQRGSARPGETVLIHGATGAVGIAAVQMACAAGMRVLATGGSESGRQRLLTLGADAVFDHHDPQHLDAIQAVCNGNGVDVILEMLANVNLGDDLSILAHGARVLVIGNRGDVTINPRHLMQRRASVIGVALAHVTPLEYREAHAAMGALIRSGLLSPIVADVLPLARAADAHVQVMTDGGFGKLVLATDQPME